MTGRWVGVNFWSRAGGPRMWTERYSPEVVRGELDVLAEHGCNVTRSFCHWPDFMPAPERLDPAALERYADFLTAHRERDMTTIPTFIVGHMSGQNWDPAWRGERDLYRDVWLVAQQAGSSSRSPAGSPPIRPSRAGCSPTRCRSTAGRLPPRTSPRGPACC